MHNGICLNSKAVEVADNLKKNSKKLYFYLTHLDQVLKVKEFLKKMKMDEKF